MNRETQALLDSMKEIIDDPQFITEPVRESGLRFLTAAGVPVDMLPARIGELYFKLVVGLCCGALVNSGFASLPPKDILPLVKALFSGMYFASQEYEGR